MSSAPGRSGTRARLGALCWIVQPLYLVCELIAFAFVAAPYSLLHNTMSELGAVTCGELTVAGIQLPVCSPAHLMYNAATVIFGALMSVGAVLLIKVSASRLHKIVCGLWMIAGASTVAVGLVPLDVDLGLHALVAWPSFLCQPIALLLHALLLLRRGRRGAWALIALAVVMAVGTGAVLLSRDLSWIGLSERLALWPVFLVLPVLALALARREPAPGRSA